MSRCLTGGVGLMAPLETGWHLAAVEQHPLCVCCGGRRAPKGKGGQVAVFCHLASSFGLAAEWRGRYPARHSLPLSAPLRAGVLAIQSAGCLGATRRLSDKHHGIVYDGFPALGPVCSQFSPSSPNLPQPLMASASVAPPFQNITYRWLEPDWPQHHRI